MAGAADSPLDMVARLGPAERAWDEVDAALEACTGVLCRLRGCAENLEHYLEAAGGGGGGGAGPCPAVWTAGATAFRCSTCAVTPSSAICAACFRVRRRPPSLQAIPAPPCIPTPRPPLSPHPCAAPPGRAAPRPPWPLPTPLLSGGGPRGARLLPL